jgi:uncharacterized membrane protein YdfJ with MMPL/SSD domain
VHVGGGAAVGNALNETVTEDLARAESIAVPVTLVLLLLVFGRSSSRACRSASPAGPSSVASWPSG